MKNIRSNFIAAVLFATGALIVSDALRAADLPQTTARQQFSVTQGFTAPSLPALQRSAALSQNEVSAALIQTLRPGSVSQSARTAAALHTAGDQWSLDVSSDGSTAEFRDLAVAARAHSLGRPLAEKMTASELEQKGRAFIASQLASVIVAGTGEELIALRADYRTEGGQDLASGQISTAVVANRIVFGRTINGVPVVGNGSRVILTFTNDGSLESFRYDWPAYRAGIPQTVVSPGEVLSRLQQVMQVRSGLSSPFATAVPTSGARAYPVALGPNTELQSLECGYYDAGSGGKAQSVQPGCSYLAVSRDANGMREGFAGAVPAGALFTPDSGWLENQILTTR